LGGALYGMTTDGGAPDHGVIFKINTDGSNYTNLHVFAGPPADGQDPFGGLSFSDGSFFGMTSFGGNNNKGIIFKMDVDGSNYTNLYDFAGGTDGAEPYSSLLHDSGYFYGFTSSGGVSNFGTAFMYTEIPEGGIIMLLLSASLWLLRNRH